MVKGFILFIGMLSLFSCKNDAPPDDPQPSEPAREFSAMINGTPWETAAPIGSPEIDAEHYLGNYFDITGFNYLGQGISHIFIKVYALNDTGVFILNETNIADYYDSPNNKHYSTDATHLGTLHITQFDYEHAKVAGEFEFIGVDTTSGDSAVITSGQIINVTFHKY